MSHKRPPESLSSGMDLCSSPKKLKQEQPVFQTPLTCSPSIVNSGSTSPFTSNAAEKDLSFKDDPVGTRTETKETDPVTDRHGWSGVSTPLTVSSDCSVAELKSLQKELEKRDTQRDDLVFQMKSLADKNKRYRCQLEKQETSRREQQKIAWKVLETQIADKDELIKNMQDLLAEHESKLQLLEEQLQGNITSQKPTPTDVPSSRKLVDQIKRLQSDKCDLCCQLEAAQADGETCKQEQCETVESLQQVNVKLQNENESLKREIDKLQALGADLESSTDSAGHCSTDTEKQLEKVQEENVKLLQQIVGFKHIDYRRSTISTSSENEQIQCLQEENSTLSLALSTLKESLKKQEKHAREIEVRSRHEKLSMSTQNNKLSRQILELQAEIMLLQAAEPEVMHHIERVHVEVESEDMKNDITAFEQACMEKDKQISKFRQEKLHLENKIGELVAEKEELQKSFMDDIEALQHSREYAIEDVRRQTETEMHRLVTSQSQMRQTVIVVKKQFDEVKSSYVTLLKQVKQFPNIITNTVKTLRTEAGRAIENVTQHNKDLVKKYLREMYLRKKYHNELVELKGNIRVFCRVRPWIKEDGLNQQTEMIISFDPDDDGLVYISNKGRIQTFEVDRVFTSKSTQIEVFDEVRSLVTSCIDGFNVCIFAYGQTGSGKTYTMEGPPGDAGINQRAIQELFNEISERDSDWDYSISVSVMEIYNEVIRDLLSEDNSYKLEVKLNSEGGYHVPGLVCVQVNTVQDVNKIFHVGQQNRATATTNMNEHSSRSHALLCITLTGVNKTTNTRTIGKLNLVDLAGSERVSKSGADGTRLKEAQSINKSLACLGDVIHALRCRQNHIPYRNSKLTFLLQDSLGGDSKTLMIVQVAPVACNVGETVCSLAFAQRVRMVELGAASKRVENGDVNEIGQSIPGSPQPSNGPLSPSSSHTPGKHTPSKNTPIKSATPLKSGTPGSIRPLTPSQRFTRQLIAKRK